ncbi:hypothetical protein C8J57DRAFT_1306164 [Mycena rebaudengoi]|nr:hypothetical protein C8J57DRAFT_1329178 [Mycena rebaudengoi]KAJ7278196.1 hypothetical protein C8J57DRAFT_1306164 [Mycena rebaudengoi]
MYNCRSVHVLRARFCFGVCAVQIYPMFLLPTPALPTPLQPPFHSIRPSILLSAMLSSAFFIRPYFYSRALDRLARLSKEMMVAILRGKNARGDSTSTSHPLRIPSNLSTPFAFYIRTSPPPFSLRQLFIATVSFGCVCL